MNEDLLSVLHHSSESWVGTHWVAHRALWWLGFGQCQRHLSGSCNEARHFCLEGDHFVCASVYRHSHLAQQAAQSAWLFGLQNMLEMSVLIQKKDFFPCCWKEFPLFYETWVSNWILNANWSLAIKPILKWTFWGWNISTWMLSHQLLSSCLTPFLSSGQRTLHHRSDTLDTVILVNPNVDSVVSEVRTRCAIRFCPHQLSCPSLTGSLWPSHIAPSGECKPAASLLQGAVKRPGVLVLPVTGIYTVTLIWYGAVRQTIAVSSLVNKQFSGL